MQGSADEVIERLHKGEALEDIIRSLRPDAETELLKRCAAVRSFDRSLFDEILRRDLDGAPSFAEIVDRPDVERVPGTADVYWLRDSVRSDYLRMWWSDPGTTLQHDAAPPELRALSGTLANHFERTGMPVERLYHLLLVDPDSARRLFDDLYEEADQRFDLAACQDLVAVLAQRSELVALGPELTALRSDRERYLEARTLWSLEYHRSARFLRQTGVMRPLEGLLDGQPSRVLQIFARGGMGKTMLLRWFIARYCVPQRRVPCAWLDFDLASTHHATRYPWLVLVKLAGQLDRQIPHTPFLELRKRYERYEPLLHRDRDLAAEEAAQQLDRRRRRPGADSEPVELFVTALNEAAGDQPVLLVLDTVEEMLLRADADLRPLLDVLVTVHDRCERLRILVTGRYDLGDPQRLPAYVERLAAQTMVLEPFDEQDRVRYLRGNRRIERDDAIDVIVRQDAARLPFTLAVYADLVRQQPDIPAEELARYDPRVIYLIERIVERIEDERVRWLVRYGAVARLLTLDFVRTVMRPHLVTAMSGRSVRDTPRRDPLPERLGTTAFRTDLLGSPEDALDLDELWRKLLWYAGSYSWVEVLSETPVTTVRFHPDVRDPMRQLIRSHGVYTDLHRDAASHYERLAAAQPEQRLEWLRKAVYHRFQMEGARAEGYWWAQIAEAARDQQPEIRLGLAEEVLDRTEYLSDDGLPRPWDETTPMLTLDGLANAHLERALASLELVSREDAAQSDLLWSRVEASFAAINDLQPRLRAPGVLWWRLTYIEAMLYFRDGDLGEASRLLGRALALAANGTGERPMIELALGNVRHAQGRSDEAAASYRSVLESPSLSTDAEVEAWERLAHEHAERGDLTESLADTERALAATGHSTRLRIKILLQYADRLLAAGLPAAALAALDARPLPDARPQLAAALCRSRAACLLALRRPEEALDALDQVERYGAKGELPAEDLAVTLEQRGAVLGVLMEFKAALTALDAAIQRYGEAEDHEGVSRAQAICAEIKLRGLGNLGDAARRLGRADAAAPEPGGDAWLRTRVLRAELHDRLGEGQRAQELMAATITDLQARPAPPQRLVLAAVEGLAARSAPVPERWLALLNHHLARIRPESARLASLAGLWRCPSLAGALTEDTVEFRRLTAAGVVPSGRVVQPLDQTVLGIYAAEVTRLTGGDLTRSLDQLFGDLAEQMHPVVWLERLRAVRRHQDPGPDITAWTMTAVGPWRQLRAAFFVEQAEAIAKGNDIRAAQDPVSKADELLMELETAGEEPSQWVARTYALKAELARRDGDATGAAQLASLAGSVFARLGDPLAERAAVARTGVADQPAWQVPDSRVHVRLDLDGDLSVTVQSRSARRHPAKGLLSIDELAGRLTAELGAVAEELERRLGVPTSPTGVQLELANELLYPIAWELGLRFREARPCARVISREQSARAEVRAVQEALDRVLGTAMVADGRIGPHTHRALREFQQRRGLPADGVPDRRTLTELQRAAYGREPLRVLVLRSRPSLQRAVQREVGPDVVELYARAGARVEVLEDLSTDALEGVIAAVVPGVIHVAAGLDQSGASVYLDFSGADQMSTTDLNRKLHLYPPGSPAPVIILDITRPATPTETARHLLLRNEFAGQLFALGNVPAVIGTGLAPFWDNGGLQVSLVQRLLDGDPVIDVCTALRRFADMTADWDTVMSYGAVALYAHSPTTIAPGGTSWKS